MIQLTEFLSTKIKNKVILDEFPDNPTYNQLIDFLKNKGFEECIITSDDLFVEPIYVHIERIMKTKDTPRYISLDVMGKYYCVRFFNTGKYDVYTDHTVFLCRVTNNGIYKNPTIEHVKSPGLLSEPAKAMKFDEFRRKVNEYFGW